MNKSFRKTGSGRSGSTSGAHQQPFYGGKRRSGVGSTSNTLIYKKVNKTEVGQSKANSETAKTSDSNPGSGAHSVENAGHLQPALQGVCNTSAPVAVAKPSDATPKKKGRRRPFQRAPSASTNSDSTLLSTPDKGNGASGFPLQFGSIRPELMNEIQAQRDVSRVMPDQSKNDVAFGKKSVTQETKTEPQAKKDVPQAQKASNPSGVPMTEISMPSLSQQPTSSMKFGGHDPQIQSQSALQVPLQMGNPSLIPQQAFVPDNQFEHSLIQTKQIMHQGQNEGQSHQLPYQHPHHLGNVKFSRPGEVSQLDWRRNGMMYDDRWNKQPFHPYLNPRRLEGILNKLTPQNFEILFKQVIQVKIDSVITLIEVIYQIFEKAVMKPSFCEMYANICQHLASKSPVFSVDNKMITFKKLLVNKCQEEFERKEREEQEADTVDGEEHSEEIREKKCVKACWRWLGNIRFIGELYKKSMLPEKIMHECIKKLLRQFQNPDEVNIEALCKLMSTIGEMIDHPRSKERMDAYFDTMAQLSNNMVPSRVQFMLKDAIDFRKNKWQQKRRVERPNKIEDIHRTEKTHDQDLPEKAVALAAKRVAQKTKIVPQVKRDTPLASTSPLTQAPNPPDLPITGISMPSQLQTTVSVQLDGIKIQARCQKPQDIPTSSLQISLQVPLQMGHPSQIPQQIFVAGPSDEHSLIQTNHVMHQVQSMGHNHQLPCQPSHHPRNVKFGRPDGVSLLDPHRHGKRYGDRCNKQHFPPYQDPKKLKGILNKLTPQNFERLLEQVIHVNIDNVITLTEVIAQIFDKAVTKPTSCEMYASFCLHLSSELPDLTIDDEKITFRRLLLNKCQEEFKIGEREEQEGYNGNAEGDSEQSEEVREKKRVKAHQRWLGNIIFIGELYKKRMLTERIMHECIKKLLGQYQNPDEVNIEGLCKLMSTIGNMIDHPKAKERMDAYFDIMGQLCNNMVLSSRVRFMLKDTIDLRKNKWQPRHKIDAAQERQQ